MNGNSASNTNQLLSIHNKGVANLVCLDFLLNCIVVRKALLQLMASEELRVVSFIDVSGWVWDEDWACSLLLCPLLQCRKRDMYVSVFFFQTIKVTHVLN